MTPIGTGMFFPQVETEPSWWAPARFPTDSSRLWASTRTPPAQRATSAYPNTSHSTSRQGRHPPDIPTGILGVIPVRLSWGIRTMIPTHSGYNLIFSNMHVNNIKDFTKYFYAKFFVSIVILSRNFRTEKITLFSDPEKSDVCDRIRMRFLSF